MADALQYLCGLRKQRGLALTHALLLGQCSFSVLIDVVAASADGSEDATADATAEGQEFGITHCEVALVAELTEAAEEGTRQAATATLAALALAAPASAVPLAQWALSSDTCDPLQRLTRWLVLFPAVHTSPALEHAFFTQVVTVMEAPGVGAVAGLRLLSTYWQITGRGWPQLRSAILAKSSEPVTVKEKQFSAAEGRLRTCVASTLCAVAHSAPEKCITVISAVDQCLRDLGGGAALALEALAALCAAVRSPPA
jgi:hypothetical protein